MTSRSDEFKTEECRFAFTQGLFKLREDLSGNKNWTCTLLFPKGSKALKSLQDAVVKAATEEWGDKAIGWLRDGTIKMPFLDGDSKQGRSAKTGQPHAGFAGQTFVRVKSGEEYKPQILNQSMQLITHENEFYSGCYGRAVIQAFTWETTQNGRGISFGIRHAQKSRDGDRLGGGGSDPSQYFEKIEDTGAAPDTTQDGKGAAGLFG